MFKNIGTIFQSVTGLLTGNIQTSIAGVLGYIFTNFASGLPANIQAAITALIGGAIVTVMHKGSLWNWFLTTAAGGLVILQYCGSLIPSANIPLHVAVGGIIAAYAAFLQDEHIPTTN